MVLLRNGHRRLAHVSVLHNIGLQWDAARLRSVLGPIGVPMDRWTLAKTGCALAVCVGAIATATWRAGFLGGRNPAEKLYAAVQDGSAAFRKMEMFPLADASVDDIRAALDVGSVKYAGGMSAIDVAAVRDEAATFLYKRFVRSDLDEYISWRESKGCKLRDEQDIRANERAFTDYSTIIGRPIPSTPTVKSIFAAYWTATLAWGGGLNRPAAIARTAAGSSITIGDSKDSYYPRLFLEGELGNRLWYGPDSAAMRSWFSPRTQPKDVVKRYGKVGIAEVGIVMQWADGSRRPLILGFFRDPVTVKWVLWQVNQNNFDPRLTPGPMEY